MVLSEELFGTPIVRDGNEEFFGVVGGDGVTIFGECACDVGSEGVGACSIGTRSKDG